MKESKGFVAFFVLAYGLILLILFSGEQQEETPFSIARIDYNKAEVGVDIDTLYDKSAIVQLASNMFSGQGIRTMQEYHAVEETYNLKDLTSISLLDHADNQREIQDFYFSFDYYDEILDSRLTGISLYESYEDYLDQFKYPEIAYKATIKHMKDLLDTVDTIASYDVYRIQDDNAYIWDKNIRLFRNTEIGYYVLCVDGQDNMIFVDEMISLGIAYAYELTDESIKVSTVSNTDEIQAVYKGIEAMMAEDSTRVDIEYDNQKMMILKQEE